MQYQIGIVGAGIIAIYSAIVLAVLIWPLAKALKKFSWRWYLLGPIAFVLLAAPWAEEYWIASRFEEVCKDAGVHVYKQVEVDGFVDDLRRSDRYGIKTGLWNYSQKALADWDARGYRFQENMLMDGGVVHLERTTEGIEASILESPTARYHYKYAYQPSKYIHAERIDWKVEKRGTVVIDSESGEVIARDTWYRRGINFAEGSWRVFFGQVTTTCSGPKTERLPLAALKPIVK